jgi:Flp pilus assembly protein TadG
MTHPRSQSGQASVETVAVIPFLILAALAAWQIALAGHALWLTAGAARTAARAETVGANPERAARSALPDSMERGLSVERRREGGIRVRVKLPLLSRRWRSPVYLSAASSLGRER